MNTPEKLRETLADVIAKHNEASGEYTLLRNRARQGAITNELVEIVAGSEALK